MSLIDAIGKKLPKTFNAISGMSNDAKILADDAIDLASYHARDMGRAARQAAADTNAAMHNMVSDMGYSANEMNDTMGYHLGEIRKAVSEDINENIRQAKLSARNTYNKARQPGVDYILKGKDGYGTGRAKRLGIEVDADGFVNRNVTNMDIAKGVFLHEDGSLNKTRAALASVGAVLGTAGVARIGFNTVEGNY